MDNCLIDPMEWDTINKSIDNKPKQVKAVKTYTCFDCGLRDHCKTPEIPVYGKGKKEILLILETPCKEEDAKGEPWHGFKNVYLQELIEERTGLDIQRDCYTVFAIRCLSPAIKIQQCEACRKRLHDTINNLKPRVIITFGYWSIIGVAGDILTGKSRGKTVGEWAGYVIPDQRFLTWICPTYSAFNLKLDFEKPDTVCIDQMVEHIKKAIVIKETNVEKYEYEKQVEVVSGKGSILELLETLWARSKKEGSLVLALDYETTGRKPHREGHAIVSIALSDGKTAWSFLYDKSDNAVTIVFKAMLRSKSIYWIVHNAQFEWLWSYNVFGEWPANLKQDTCIGAHVLNSQKRVGLKPLTYCFFGVGGYDDILDPYMVSSAIEESQYGANGINTIKKAPKNELLKYNALDALFTFRLAAYLDTNLSSDNKRGYAFLMQSCINLVIAQNNGMRVALDKMQEVKSNLSKEIIELLVKIGNKAVTYGWPKGLAFRPSAADDIAKLLYEIKGYKAEKTTASGKLSTDKNALSKIKDPIIDLILEWKKLIKLRDTYIDGLACEAVGGYIHPFFNLYTVVTFRSSSSNPNFQNFPKRDKVVSETVRSLLFPFPGHKLNEYDYKAVEVAVSACYNKDTNLIKYIKDPKTDMHRDTGIDLFMYNDNPQDFQKFDRGIAKNKFVFPEFYGSYYMQTAPDLWDACSKEAKSNLKKHGVNTLADFIEHVREMERVFWEERFPEYTEWKNKMYKSYLKKGYIDSYTGFRYYGPMTRNECLNIAIQGSAHHVLLRTFNKVSDLIKKEKLNSKMIGQIHDSMLPSVDPSEEAYIDKMIWYYGTQEILNEFKWICVPLGIEKSSGEIDGAWSTLKEVGLLGLNGKIKE